MNEVIEQESRAVAVPTGEGAAWLRMIESAMMRPDFDVAKLQAMFEMKREFDADAARKAYNEAFSAFKAEAIVILKNCSVTSGPLSGKKYAELFAVVNAATPALSRHGLSASWKLTMDERDWIEVTCTLKHVGGHSEIVSMGAPPDSGGAKNKIQERASTVTYLERYTLKAILGLSEQEDDDDGGKGQEEGRPEVSDKDAILLQAGQDAAMEGVATLTAWWGKLHAGQRSRLNKDFAQMRKAAAAVDARGGNA